MMRCIFCILSFLYAITAHGVSGGVQFGTPDGCGVETILYTGFVIGFDGEKHIPRWALYELHKEQLSINVIPPGKNKPNFKPDSRISQCAVDSDYRNSGKTRGHMVPKADLKWNLQVWNDSFYFTNVCPQGRDFNQGAWETLEKEVRHFARVYERIIVITGPVVSDDDDKIGSSMVDVPKKFYKVIYAPSLNQMIAFIAPITASPNAYAPRFACSVREVERATSLNFFPAMASVEQERLETKIDLDAWQWSSGSLKQYRKEVEKENQSQNETGYWLIEASGKRHNSKCQLYRFGRGHFCAPDEGRPAGCCGG